MISDTQAELADFRMKFTNLCYHGNKAAAGENFNESMSLADP